MVKKSQVLRRRPAATHFTRRAPLRATSFNPDTGGFSAVIATETPVLRRDFQGDYLEVLSLNPKAVRLGRLQSGAAPLLDSHRAASARDQIGIVTDARIERGQLVADARLSPRDDVMPIASDLAAGTPPNVSVGYRVYSSQESRAADGTPILTRIDWEPYEMSFTPVPADPETHVRNLRGVTMRRKQKPAQIIDDVDSAEENEIEELETRSEDLPEPAEPAQQRRRMNDREARQAFTLAAKHGMTGDVALRHIESGVTLVDFRALVLEGVAGRELRISPLIAASGNGDTFDNPDFLGTTIGDALYARMAGKAPEGAAREFMGRSLLDMGSMLLESRGERVSWANRDRLAGQIMLRGGTHSTSDFPVLLTQSGDRVLQDAYRAAQSPLKALARRRDAKDFRPLTQMKLSEAPQLLKVLEGEEVKYGSRSEAKEAFQVETFARIFSLSRQAIINDDLSAFADTNTAWGRAAAETEGSLLVSLFTVNGGDGADLDDGNPLYATSRGNKASAGTAIDVTNLGAARQALREMKGLDGKTPIGVTPKHLVVGPAKETEGEQVLASIAAAQVSEANPFSGKLTLHVEPRFTGNSWRLFADQGEIATILIAYLSGQDGPMLEQRDGWNTLGMEFRAVFDFGCGLADWRGTYLNSGN